MTKTARMLAALALIAFGALAAFVVDWERKSEIHGLFGPLEVPFGFTEPYRFAFNTLFYAGLPWLIISSLLAWRRARQRARRIKRGLCPKCAYPVGTNAVCTECGAAVAPPRKPIEVKM